MIKTCNNSVELDTSDSVTLRLRNFALPFFTPQAYTGTFSAAGFCYSYTIWAEASGEGEERRARLTHMELQWRDFQGNACSETLPIVERRSNLGLGYFYTLVCPFSHRPCRKFLVCEDGYLVSRHDFPRFHYSKQYETKNALLSAFGYIWDKDPYRKNGKEYYRGKLTPYGRKLRKCEERQEILSYKYLMHEMEKDKKAYLSEYRREEQHL